MRILFLTLMISFLSHSAFGSDSESAAPTDEELWMRMGQMMSVPGFKTYYDKMKFEYNLREVQSVADHYTLVRDIK